MYKCMPVMTKIIMYARRILGGVTVSHLTQITWSLAYIQKIQCVTHEKNIREPDVI